MPPAGVVLKNILLCALFLPILAPSGVLARDQDGTGANEKLVACRMTFNLKGWSAFYKTAQGDGTITCDNGQKAKVRIKAKGGGITFGKSEIVGGTGRFTGATGSLAFSGFDYGDGNISVTTKGTISTVGSNK